MSNYKGPTEGGSGGKLGHTAMEHWTKSAELKESSNVHRRVKDKLESLEDAYITRKVLFVCGRARRRSLTAEEIFVGDPAIEAQAAGISDDADAPVTPELIDWADQILVMENRQRTKLLRKFGSSLRDKRIAVLDIPDRYAFMDPQLIDRLRKTVKRYI